MFEDELQSLLNMCHRFICDLDNVGVGPNCKFTFMSNTNCQGIGN